MRLLTASRLKSARLCRRLHHLRYDLLYRSVVDTLVLRFGTLIHSGLEAWWLAKQRGLPQDQWLAAALDAVAGETDPFDAVRAWVLLCGYHERWKDEPYSVLGVEMKFEGELRNPLTGAKSRTWRLAGKLDVLVRDLRDGRILIIEHKTSAEDVSQGSKYWRRLRMDGQVSIYFEGARSLGLDPEACLYDVIGKPGQRPGQVPLVDADGVKIVHDAVGLRVRTKDGKKWRETGDTAQGYVLQTRPETPEEFRDRLVEAVSAEPGRYFCRGEVVRLEADMNAALADIWQLGQELREAELAERHPRNPDACEPYGQPCSFFDVCTGAASLEDPSLFTRSTTAHPELEENHAARA